MFKTFGFIGLGLIGGSIARGIREQYKDATIIAYNRSPEPLKEAVKDGVVDVAVSSVGEEFRSCELIFLCTPVQKNEEYLQMVKPFLAPHAILTDVGSVKESIHQAVKQNQLEDQFIGGHPMAGSERVGYSNSKASILQNAYYVITPTETVDSEKVAWYKELVETLGCISLVTDYKKHDYVVAAISHLPHVIAASLVNLVKDSDTEEGLMKLVAAGGFKDITRIASSSSAMWQQICLTNTDNIVSLLSDYIDALSKMKEILQAKNEQEIYDFFASAREYRDSFTAAGSGPLKVMYRLSVDIADKPGALASIATLLASNDISIKNIGIIHNREYQGGDLKIEVEKEEELERARMLLISNGYTVHE